MENPSREGMITHNTKLVRKYHKMNGNAGIPPDNEYRETQLRHARWGIAVQDYVGTDLFKYVQFINTDEDVMYGSSIQKVVCKAVGVPEDDSLEFWTNIGNETVQKVLKRKRQSITTSFRMKFESK